MGGLSPGTVLPNELAFLSFGLLGTLLVSWRMARQSAPAQTLRACLPWAAVGGLLFATAWWTLLQPMEMRATSWAPDHEAAPLE